MHRSPIDVLAVVGALGTVFAMLTTLLVAREERRGLGAEPPRVRVAKEPRVRVAKEPRVRTPKEPRVRVAEEPPVRIAKEPRVRTPKAPPAPAPASVATEPREVLTEPDPRRPAFVLNLDAYTEARSE